MDCKRLLEYISHLRKKGDSHKLIVFVGAGVSKNVPSMPSWSELIQKMADSIGYSRCSVCSVQEEGCKKCCRFKNIYSNDEYLKIPQYVYNADKDLYFSILKESISSTSFDAPLSYAIFDINPVHIITTNYDKLLESSSNLLRDTFDVIVEDGELLNSEKNHYIIKMHGDIERPETIVLKEGDYLAYSREHVLIEMFVKALLADHTILFLGYSMNDYNIKLIVNWLNYMRSQNDAIGKDARIGYILQDSENVSETDQIYFQGNNIEIINLRNMPIIKNVPDSIKHPVGQRLYSFLRIIHDPSLEIELGQELIYDRAVELMKSIPYVDLKSIISILCLHKYQAEYERLCFFETIDYDTLTTYLGSKTPKAIDLAQYLVNAGIRFIECVGIKERPRFFIADTVHNDLLDNPLYQLYAENRYIELYERITQESEALSHCFYYTIFSWYTKESLRLINQISFVSLVEAEKVAYLFNMSLHKWHNTLEFDRKTISAYINNMPSKQMQDMYSMYVDILDGNQSMYHAMRESLEKLKDHYSPHNHFLGTSSLTELQKIKLKAYDLYSFHFRNHACYYRLAEYRKAIALYIEAILVTNGEFIEQVSSEGVFKHISSKKQKYSLNIIDFDMLTKSVRPKDLANLLDEYDIEVLITERLTLERVIKSFCNLVKSMLEFEAFGSGQIVEAFLNYGLLLQKLPLTDKDKEKISICISNMLTNERFITTFFSVHFYEWRKALKIVYELVQLVGISPVFATVEAAIKSEYFWEYVVNVNTYVLGKFFGLLLDPCAEDIYTKLDNIISELDPKQKIILIELLGDNVNPESVGMYKNFLRENYSMLNPNQLFDFVHKGWLDFTDEDANALIEKALSLARSRIKGYYAYPDPLESTLQVIYILYIIGKIQDISGLTPLVADYDFLQFFLEDASFDYSKIDFSNYMWENIARQPKFMDRIVLHKEQIIPTIQRKIDLNAATEFERKILYGILKDKDTVLL